jgi:hypothetical protein
MEKMRHQCHLSPSVEANGSKKKKGNQVLHKTRIDVHESMGWVLTTL